MHDDGGLKHSHGGAGACPMHRAEMSRTYRFEALSRESFIFHKDVATSPRPNKTLDVKTDVHAKWLGADCGDVKP